MAVFRNVHVSFWQDAKVMEDMTPEDKYFYLYLLTNPNTTQIGIYSITKKQMAFDTGYSIESVQALLKRFENDHQLIQYNPETREIALLNWGKYNLNRGGKPIEDCIRKELKAVKDKEFIELIIPHINNETIQFLFRNHLNDALPNKADERDESIDDTYHDTYHDTSTIRGQEEEKEEEEKKNTSRRKKTYAEDSPYFQMASYLKQCILSWKPNARVPQNLHTWVDECRLLCEKDGRQTEEIQDVIDWATTHPFWQPNILSASSLREKFDTLQGQMINEQNKKVNSFPIKAPYEPARGNQYEYETPSIVEELKALEKQRKQLLEET